MSQIKTLSQLNKPSLKDRLRLIAAGVQKHYPSGQMTLASQTFNMPSDLVKAIQADIDASDAADKGRANWLALVQVQRDAHQKVGPVLRALKHQVLAQFGEDPDAGSTLADFGYSPQKNAVRSVATKAEAVTKGQATRAARHTMGKNQKKNVKGTVAATAPAQPSPVSPPAAPGPVASAPSQGAASGGAAPHTT